MSAFTDRLYAEMVRRNGGAGRPPRVAPRSYAQPNQYAAWRAVTGRGGMGVPPMKRSATDPELTPPDALAGRLNAGQAVDSKKR